MPRLKRDLTAPQLTRREFVAAPAALAAGKVVASTALPAGKVVASTAPAQDRPKIAALTTLYRLKSHGQGIIDRFLDGYGWDSRHYRPDVDIVSLYVDQKPAGDLTAERAVRHPELKVYRTIAEALTRGGNQLAVDGVLLIGEHGNYGRNAKGQRLFPRYEFFKHVVDVFRRSGRSVPVFCDKHLSWNWEWALSMVETSRALGFPLLAGSSLPVTWRLPAIDVPFGAKLVEAVGVGYGGLDSYDFHGLETIQCMVERRAGGESGVVAVTALRGESVWKALQTGSWSAGGCDPRLLEACLCRSFTLASPRAGYGNAYPEPAQWPALVQSPAMYRIEHADGLKSTLLMLSGLVRDFTVAVRTDGTDAPLSTQMYLPGLGPGQTLPNFFSPLAHHIETMFRTGKPPYPVERTLLTTGVLATALDSLHSSHERIETPALARVRYQAPRESTFWRN
jgi:hypothetical protein